MHHWVANWGTKLTDVLVSGGVVTVIRSLPPNPEVEDLIPGLVKG